VKNRPIHPQKVTRAYQQAGLKLLCGKKKFKYFNVFMGFSLRLNQLVTTKKPDNFDNLTPGF
jgi:hypothetical protein